MEHWTRFASTFVWQVILAAFLLMYRNEIRDIFSAIGRLIKNITGFKLVSGEFVFQPTLPEIGGERSR